MKPKRLTKSISFLITKERYRSIESLCDEKGLGIGELLREILDQYFRQGPDTEA